MEYSELNGWYLFFAKLNEQRREQATAQPPALDLASMSRDQLQAEFG